MAGVDLKIKGKLYTVARTADVYQRGGRHGVYNRDGGVGAHDADSVVAVYRVPALYHQYICGIRTEGITRRCAGMDG